MVGVVEELEGLVLRVDARTRSQAHAGRPREVDTTEPEEWKLMAGSSVEKCREMDVYLDLK